MTNEKEKSKINNFSKTKDKKNNIRHKFFAFTNRLKLINRWGLMFNRHSESVAEHSYNTAVIAHCLGIVDNKVFGKNTDANKAATYALFHDITEIFTGDMPTPVKYKSVDMINAYAKATKEAEDNLLACLPVDLQLEYNDVISPKKNREKEIAEFADKISALIKCYEEVASGNNEFLNAKKTTYKKVLAYKDDTINYFIDNFLESFTFNLDELINE